MDVALRGSPPNSRLERAKPRVLALAIAVQVAAVLAAVFLLEIPIPPVSLTSGIAALAIADVVTFVLLGILVDIHIGELRIRHKQLAADKDARERHLRGLAALAAGTAHEMGTPLSTMALVVGDLRRSHTPPPDWKESMEVLWEQIQACKRSLSSLAEAAAAPEIESSRCIPARQLVLSLVERIRLMRPEVSVHVRSMCAAPDLLVKADLTLPQALLDLINDAADASPHEVELHALERDARFVLEILDRGPGIPRAARERLGESSVPGREPGSGRGIGVSLARTTIERLGGTATVLDRKDGGTRVHVELPAFRRVA